MVLVFGFIQQEFTAEERGPNYEIDVGFLSGTILGAFALNIMFNPGTAGKYIMTGAYAAVRYNAYRFFRC